MHHFTGHLALGKKMLLSVNCRYNAGPLQTALKNITRTFLKLSHNHLQVAIQRSTSGR